jgi:hypothetical protein
MATQIVMDHTGDTRHVFDAADENALSRAEERFKQLTFVGFTAAVRTAPGQTKLVRTFDPTAGETSCFRGSSAANRGSCSRERFGSVSSCPNDHLTSDLLALGSMIIGTALAAKRGD